jgi:uncharacterized protein (DUF1501 family)
MAEPQGLLSGNGDYRQCLVVVFLRGGADGLSLVAPIGDDHYYSARPRIAIGAKEALPLDGFFGLNPLLASLRFAYDEGDLAFIHAAGSEDATRSHFEAQDLMEHGGIVAGGWLGRFLRYREHPSDGALAAIAIGRAVPESLRGAPSATVMESLDDFSLGGNSENLARQLERLYQPEAGMLGDAARSTLDALRRIEAMRGTAYRPGSGAEYPSSEFGQGLKQVARLIKARVGLEAVSIDLGGWDSHFAQGTLISPLMTNLSSSLAAFHADLGQAMETTNVVVMTEFGRRVGENTAFGTDHGRGGVMMVLGGGIKGGRVLGEWPGLEESSLTGPGDLPVTTNYRNVLAPILSRQGAGDNLGRIFPEFEVQPLSVYL